MQSRINARFLSVAMFLVLAIMAGALRADEATIANEQGVEAFAENNLDLAIHYYSEAIRLKPDYADAYFNRGKAYSNKGQEDKAIADYTEVLRLKPNHALACDNRGLIYSQKGEHDKAIKDFTEAIRINPKDAEAYWYRGCAYRDKGKFHKAIADCTEVLQLKPDHVEAFYTRGNAHDKNGEYDKAIADYTESIRFKADYAEAYCCRSTVYYEISEYEKAIADCNQAIRLKSDNAKYYNNLAWLQATCPDQQYRNGTEAVANAKKACKLDGGKVWQYLGTLAAAYAESGDFEKAREWEEKAIELATGEKDKKECQSHLELYKQDKPYHEELKKK